MTNNETDTVIDRIPVTGKMDLLITTNGCIDTMGGIDMQFMLNTFTEEGGHVNSSISMEAAKEIYMSNCVIEREHWTVENQWHECYRAAAVVARDLREEGKRDRPYSGVCRGAVVDLRTE